MALVGETGSGKSTIVNLACRFYEPTTGEILIDGVDYRERSQLWHHSHLGYVLQTPQLFSGTVRDNIRYGRLDATDAEVEEAARMVNAHRFIERMEHGYDTDVGEGRQPPLRGGKAAGQFRPGNPCGSGVLRPGRGPPAVWTPRRNSSFRRRFRPF